MFGYTLPRYDKMSPSDLSVYRRYYCETCHQLKDGFGLVSTAAVSYDMTFNTVVLSALVGDSLGPGGTGKAPLCVLRKPDADSDLFRKMAAYTVLLAKWELVDDEVDRPSLKTGFLSLVLGKAIAKAERQFPEYDGLIGDGFTQLRRREEAGCTDAVLMGSEFGRTLSHALADFAGADRDGPLTDMFTALAALVYVLDAFDDLEEDYMNGTYNPYLTDCDTFRNREDFVSKNVYSMSGTVNGLLSSLQDSYAHVRTGMCDHTGIADNIVYHGLPASAKNVISGTSQAKASLKNMFRAHRERNASY
ncbi:MAG: hypothetical protein GXX87_02985 [Euryarchaeota archaeon]|jgi:hypothetical protein|nr:hypothetical protein [Euryarchaeota archaeon]